MPLLPSISQVCVYRSPLLSHGRSLNVPLTGVAIYFLSPRWPYLVNTAVSLDGGAPTLVDLVDHTRPDTGGFGPETVQWDVVWSAQNLTNATHSLVVSVGAGQRFGILDGIMYVSPSSSTLSLLSQVLRYTVLDPETTSTSSSPSPSSTTDPSSTSPSTDASPTPSPDPSPPQSSSSSSRMRITVGSVLGVLGLLLVLLSVWFCVHKRRRNRPRSEAWTIAPSATTGKFYPPPQSPQQSMSSHVSSTEKASPMRTTTTTTTGPSPISLGPPATYPSPSTRLEEGVEHPYSSAYYPQGGGNGEVQAYQNPRFGYVGVPAPQDVISPDLSLKQYAEGLGAWYSGARAGRDGHGQYPQHQQNRYPLAEQRGEDEETGFYAQDPNGQYTSPFANPNPPSSFASSSTRYTPGVPLSPITERSFSSLRDSPRTPGTPASGASGLGNGGGYFAGVRVPARQASGERAPSRQASGERIPARQGSNESGMSLSRAVMESREAELGARPPREQQHPLARARPHIHSGTVSG